MAPPLRKHYAEEDEDHPDEDTEPLKMLMGKE